MASRPSRQSSKRSSSDFRIMSKISPEEESFRLSHWPDVSTVTTARLSCTKCDTIIKPRMVTEGHVHPVLGVLLCRKCRHFFDQRQPHIQNLCAWCANEGTLFGCSSCFAKFCEGCINKNFRLARIIFQEIKERKWTCCICFSKPIWSQRALCATAKTYADNLNTALKARIAKCNAVKKSTHSQSTASGAVVNQSVSSTSHQRPSIASRSESKEKLDLLAMKTSECAVGTGDSSLEPFKDESNSCVICLLNPSIMVMYPCGHKCLCQHCSEMLSRREKLCPLCRKEFRDIIRLYE